MRVQVLIAKLKELNPKSKVYFGSDEEGFEELERVREYSSGVYLTVDADE